MNKSSFDLNWFMGCCVCMLVTRSLLFIFKIFTFGYAFHLPILFFMEFEVLLNWV